MAPFLVPPRAKLGDWAEARLVAAEVAPLAGPARDAAKTDAGKTGARAFLAPGHLAPGILPLQACPLRMPSLRTTVS